MLGNGQELFYYFCFLGFPFLITILPLNNLIIVIPIIVIIPYIYLLLINKLVGEKLQGRRIIFYCLITHFLCFKVIREIVQLPWVYFKGLDTQFLCFKTIRNNVPFFIIIDIFNSCLVFITLVFFKIYLLLYLFCVNECCTIIRKRK